MNYKDLDYIIAAGLLETMVRGMMFLTSLRMQELFWDSDSIQELNQTDHKVREYISLATKLWEMQKYMTCFERLECSEYGD